MNGMFVKQPKLFKVQHIRDLIVAKIRFLLLKISKEIIIKLDLLLILRLLLMKNQSVSIACNYVITLI